MTTLARRLGATGCAASLLGYGLELVRQRGTCDSGDPSPDTAALSVLLILLGGGLLGLVGLVVWSVAVVRGPSPSRAAREPARPARWTPPGWLTPALPLLSLLSVLPLFAAAGGGPGAWFQYCGT
jgi:hypothetical protein